jgi:hypothetical protein
MGTSELFISLAQRRDRLEQRRGFDPLLEMSQP